MKHTKESYIDLVGIDNIVKFRESPQIYVQVSNFFCIANDRYYVK